MIPDTTTNQYNQNHDEATVHVSTTEANVNVSLHGENVTHEEGVSTTHELDRTPTIFAEPIFNVGTFPVTNSLLTSWLSVIIIVVLALVIKKNIKKIPSKLQQFFEVIVEGGLDLCDQVTGNRTLSHKIFPLAFSIFVFILINNWLGLLPFSAVGTIQEHNGHQAFVPFIRGGTADINTTLALGLMAVLGSNIFGVLSIGGWKTLNKYLNINAIGKAAKNAKKEPTGLFVGPIKFFVGVLEFIGEIAKVASLSFRLFGNIFAGEVLLVSMSVLVSYAVPIPFLFLEVVVGIIQALIFAMLTLVYFTIASHDHDSEHHDEEHAKIHAEVEPTKV